MPSWISTFSLVFNILGTLALATSTQIGVSSGWGGSHMFKNACWRRINLFGWGALLLGLGMQLYASIFA